MNEFARYILKGEEKKKDMFGNEEKSAVYMDDLFVCKRLY
jgi:hypothetical protein